MHKYVGGLLRCKNLCSVFLCFVTIMFVLLFGLLCFLCSTSLVKVIGFYTEDDANVGLPMARMKMDCNFKKLATLI